MYNERTIAVVVPAYNEELLIADTLSSIPSIVDRIYAINDASNDKTQEIIEEISRKDPRVVPILHKKNLGVGAAIISGYKQALTDGMSITVVMAGDNQMEPEWLPAVLDPVVDGVADYAKGTRQTRVAHLHGMSIWRRVGNVALRWLTVIASGNPGVTDPQQGYAAISRESLESIELDAVYPYYGYCNDLIIRLSAQKRRIIEIPMPSMYHGEVSKIRYREYIPRVSMLLLRLFVLRVSGRLRQRRPLQPGIASPVQSPVPARTYSLTRPGANPRWRGEEPHEDTPIISAHG